MEMKKYIFRIPFITVAALGSAFQIISLSSYTLIWMGTKAQQSLWAMDQGCLVSRPRGMTG